MKKITFLLIAFIGIQLAAQDKKDIVLKTNVSDVTVFIKGAQIVRKTTTNLPAGKSTIRFVNLSPYIDAKSIQIKLDGEVMIFSVNHQTNYNDTLKQTAEIENYIKQINDLNDKIKIETTTKEIINEELTFMRENKKIGGNGGIDFNNLKATSTYYGEKITALRLKEIETDKKIKSLTDERNVLERKKNASGTVKPESTGEVVVNVECKAAVNIPVELSYYVGNASWFPSYDINAKDISEPVNLIYKANITQNTKENWKNVNLKISSANPNLGNVAPTLQTYFLNYSTKPPRYSTDNLLNQVAGRIIDNRDKKPLDYVSVYIKGTTIGTYSDNNGNFSLPIPSGGGELEISLIGYKTQIMPISNKFINISLEQDVQLLEESVVTGNGIQYSKREVGRVVAIESEKVEKKQDKNRPLPVAKIENQTSVEFAIKTPYTILSENKNTVVEMENYSLPANYEYYCAPKADKTAFLMANISDWEQYNLLEGEANIFFENTFVGKTILDVRYLSDTLNISLGRDKNVSVQRDKIKDYKSQKFLSTKTEVTRAWKITVRNNKKQPVSVVLFDQIPVSTLQEIEVSPENLSGAILNAENGETKWKLTLEPSQKTELDLIYKVKYPKGKTLTIE
ncbi:MAG: mucoidy inhibitor MuiA family protein [Prevotellaceae bacterium]|jgi:hypothetical protein|nr:mucoidy inhibitor MuiA family protein [Prevotellaceae bacterium]